MKTLKKIKLLCVILMLFMSANASSINDAFVLVDVSGTMKNTQANNEAKAIIQEILLGDFDISKWKGLGWDKNNVDDVIPSAFLKQGSRFCLIPFGDRDRIQTRTKCIFENPESFNTFYQQNFPYEFNDHWTYLTLAKAFVGSVSITDNVKKAYVIIYTDGRPESTKEPYDNYYQEIVDDLEYAGSNSFKKIGILRKKINAKIHYDVEIWEFTSYKTIGEEGHTSNIGTETSSDDKQQHESIKITVPSGGKTKANPLKLKKGEDFKLQWTGGAGKIIVYVKENDKYKVVAPRKSKEYFSKSTSGNTAKLAFVKSADYKVEVRGNNGVDTLFVSVSSPILPAILRTILIIGIIAAVAFGIKKIMGNNSKENHPIGGDGWDGSHQSGGSNNKSSKENLDW